jgi:hypothetical protein
MKNAKGTPGAVKAARRLLAEVHFGGNPTSDCTGAKHPENAKFLDRRAAELAYIVDEEMANPGLLAACKAVVSHGATVHTLDDRELCLAAIAKAEGKG